MKTQSPIFKSEVGAFRARANIIVFGAIVICFMLLFSGMSFFAFYKVLSGSATKGIIFGTFVFVAVSIFLLFRVIPACIRYSKAELNGDLTLEADANELRIIKVAGKVESFLWKDIKGLGIGTYYMGCHAVVIHGKKETAFGLTLSMKSKTEICEWIASAVPKTNENGA